MSNRIKELRLEKGLSQRKLAEETGISQQSLSFYEKGDRNPKIETWQKLADYFDVPVTYLQGITNDEVKKNTENIFDAISIFLDAYEDLLDKEKVLADGKKITGRDKDFILSGFKIARDAINNYEKIVYSVSNNMDGEQLRELIYKTIANKEKDSKRSDDRY